MNNLPVWKHLAIAFLILLLTIAIFLSFPQELPHPEDFSPYGYLTAFILSIIAISKVPKKAGRRGYIAIAGICLLLFLEEISFGVESDLIKPIYWERFDVEIYDLHNLIPISMRILGNALGISSWDQAKLFQYFRIDLYIALACLALIVVFLFTKKKLGNGKSQRINLIALALSSLLISSITFIGLAGLPSDPKTAIFAGYSINRLLPMLLLALSGILALLSGIILTKQDWWKRVQRRWKISKTMNWLEKRAVKLTVLALGIGIIIQLIVPMNLNSQKLVLIARFEPILIWGMAQASLLWILFSSQLGKEPGNFARMATIWMKKLQSHPAYVYALVTLLVVAFAQLIDKDWISLDQYFQFPEFWVGNWSLFFEEALEAAGGILLSASTFFFPKGSGSIG